jgi:hypothetical protein
MKGKVRKVGKKDVAPSSFEKEKEKEKERR